MSGGDRGSFSDQEVVTYCKTEYILRSTSVESTDWVSRKDKRKWNEWKEEVQQFCDNTEPLKLEILNEKESESRNRASVVFRSGE